MLAGAANPAKATTRGLVHATAFHLLALWTLQACGAEWSLEPSVQGRFEYDDNILLTSAPHESVTGLSVAPQLKLNYETERDLVSGTVAANVRRYSRGSDLDTTDTLLHLNTRRKLETGSFGLLTDYVRDTTLESELQQTGQAPARRKRRSLGLSPDGVFALTEKMDLRLGYRFNDVAYDDAASAGLFDYRDQAVYSTLQYKLSPIDEVTAAFTFSRFEPSAGPPQLDYTDLQAGYRRRFSETLTGTLNAGFAHVSGAGSDSRERDMVVGNGALEQGLETGLLALRVSRDLSPTGSGSLALVNRVTVEWSMRVRENVEVFLGASAFRTQFVSFVPPSGDSDYYQLEPRVTWNVGPDWAIQGGYNYRHLKYRAQPSADENIVYVSATYNWPKLAISR